MILFCVLSVGLKFIIFFSTMLVQEIQDSRVILIDKRKRDVDNRKRLNAKIVNTPVKFITNNTICVLTVTFNRFTFNLR